MAKYRKKPVVVEAVVWQGKYTDGTEWPDWFRDAVGKTINVLADDLWIETPEGDMRAPKGYYVIRGIEGEIYPCHPGVFAASYEAV